MSSLVDTVSGTMGSGSCVGAGSGGVVTEAVGSLLPSVCGAADGGAPEEGGGAGEGEGGWSLGGA